MENNNLRVNMTEAEKKQFDREFVFKSFIVRLLNDRIITNRITDIKVAVADILAKFEDEIDTCEAICNVSNNLTNVIIADYLDNFDKEECQSIINIDDGVTSSDEFNDMINIKDSQRLIGVKILESVILNMIDKSLDINGVPTKELESSVLEAVSLHDEKLDILLRSLNLAVVSKDIIVGKYIDMIMLDRCKSVPYKYNLKTEAQSDNNTEALIKKAITSVINKNVELSGMDISISFEGKFTIDIKSK